ncbi:MAG: glycoside hydrolase family 18 [Bacteroidia bacterium]|nr:glycoside hydrolase family 18 [Bacteroidia bacterium]
MKHNLILLVLMGFILTACSDWNEVKSIELKQANIAEQNSELYAKYLEDLKAYKKSAHKQTYVWFNNSQKQPAGQSQHLTTLPDSVDVVSLMHPKSLADWELAEIETIRKDKGTKVIFTLDFDAIKLIFDARVKEMAEQNKDKKDAPKLDFIEFLVDTVESSLSLIRKYNYDGISMAYKGKSILHMTESEKRIHIMYENAFIGIAKDWQDRNKDKMICFEGYPQNLLNKSILNSCTHIIIPCVDIKNVSGLDYSMAMASVGGVPTDRFIIAVSTTSTDVKDTKTGYWINNIRSLWGTANWITASTTPSIAGIGIYNVNNDYFNSLRISYLYTRNAINILNPSPKTK